MKKLSTEIIIWGILFLLFFLFVFFWNTDMSIEFKNSHLDNGKPFCQFTSIELADDACYDGVPQERRKAYPLMFVDNFIDKTPFQMCREGRLFKNENIMKTLSDETVYCNYTLQEQKDRLCRDVLFIQGMTKTKARTNNEGF